MFLANLNDTQKDAFMTLAYKLIAVDGVLDEGELAMMAQYKLEMNLPSDYDETQGNLETAIAAFTAEPDAVKKQIMFELVGLACAGDDYENEEYTLREILAPVGYKLDETLMKFKATQENGNWSFEVLEGSFKEQPIVEGTTVKVK